MGSVPVVMAVEIGAAVGVLVLVVAVAALVKVLSWLEFDEDDAIPEDA